MREGYCADMGVAYYCSKDCLHSDFTDEEWAEECESNDQSYLQNGNQINIQNNGKSGNNDLQGHRNPKAVSNLWNTLQCMEVNSRNIWLDDLAKHYGIDYQKKHISVRGHIYWAEYEEDEDTSLLSFETETAWDACNDLFFEINRLLDDELSISYRCCECGCEVYYTHDEGNYFPEECCVSASGEPFEDCCDDVYGTIGEAIREWTSKTGIEQGERTDEQMMDFINEYEYEDDDTYFYIRTFTFE